MKRSVTVVPADKLIGVDGIFKVCAPVVDASVHAIQWYGAPRMSGHVEYVELVDGSKPVNKVITTEEYNTFVYPYVVLWEKSK